MTLISSVKANWREDGKCGIGHFNSPECNPEHDKPCCSHHYNGTCGKSAEHCLCDDCVNYSRIHKEWRDSGGKQKWRYDGRCGPLYLLPDGKTAQCDPEGANPACQDNICKTQCEYTSYGCIDYAHMYKEQRESGGKLKWRSDGRCGNANLLSDGTPAECDPKGDTPCCDYNGMCKEASPLSCACAECLDFRLVTATRLRRSGISCVVAKVGMYRYRKTSAQFLKYVCFDGKTIYQKLYKCAYSDEYYDVNFSPVFIEASFSKVCKNDPKAYQACGFQTVLSKHAEKERLANKEALCGGHICEHNGEYLYAKCTGDQCKLENRECEVNSVEKLCDDKCDDPYWCEDESNCNGHQYGVRCILGRNEITLHPHFVCEGESWKYDCNDKSDEQNCTITDSMVFKCEKRGEAGLFVPIHNYTRCTVVPYSFGPYCEDFSDQTNCSDIERVGGYCKIGGFLSSVSKYMVCSDFRGQKVFCDDGLDIDCYESKSEGYKIHKHKTCDKVPDCSDGGDEVESNCEKMTDTIDLSFSCVRRFNWRHGNRPIPEFWIMDNVTDCMNGEDENATFWQDQYVAKLRENVFRCPGNKKRYVLFQYLCDGLESCGNGTENKICRISRDFPDIKNTTFYIGEARNVCNSIDCHEREFKGPNWDHIFGVEPIKLRVPTSKVSCKKLHGEYYLFLSCLNLCSETDVVCPLDNMNGTFIYNSCPDNNLNLIYTIFNNSYMTFVNRETDSGQFHQELFRCDNSRCIEYNQVCDITDDCGDMSDEIKCKNHMICNNTLNSSSHQFISVEQICDGIYDCFDLSDECNGQCGRRILESGFLTTMCWFMGILAIFFNTFIMVRGVRTLPSCQTEQMLISKVLMSLIGSGDFLVGLYLVTLSFYDSIIYQETFCEKQAEWLAGIPCMVLGVISTVGSQISLFTMTVLSVIRMYGLACKSMRIPEPVETKSILRVAVLAMAIIIAALVIAFTPLAPSLSDYFVQGMYYDSSYKVFIGFPNKDKHIRILQAYNDSTPSDLTWRQIGERVDSMFSNDHGNLKRTPVHFYGNDGVCLFKYFVRTDDARRSRFINENGTNIDINQNDPVVWTMLAVNLFCFAIITFCYIAITWNTRKSSQNSGQQNNPERLKEERAMQKKVMVIIVTDFLCWVPFIIISGLHNLNTIEFDASEWYTPFAMTVLPLNSVINPVIYDKALGDLIREQFEKLCSIIRIGASRVAVAANNRQQQDENTSNAQVVENRAALTPQASRENETRL